MREGALILDACCGSRMFWFDKEHPDAVYMDNRRLDTTLCDGRTLKVEPDVVADFKNMPFDDESFNLVVFDPPHLIRAGETSWMRLKYGCLDKDSWRDDLRRGFDECIRVLKANGVLVFKWNEDQIKLSELLDAIGARPLFGDKRSKTHWMVFMKFKKEDARMDKDIDAVVDAARCYAAVARSVDADTPLELLNIVARRRRALIKAVDRLEGNSEE